MVPTLNISFKEKIQRKKIKEKRMHEERKRKGRTFKRFANANGIFKCATDNTRSSTGYRSLKSMLQFCFFTILKGNTFTTNYNDNQNYEDYD